MLGEMIRMSGRTGEERAELEAQRKREQSRLTSRRQRVQAYVAKLPDGVRGAIVRYYLYGWSRRQAAINAGISERTLYRVCRWVEGTEK